MIPLNAMKYKRGLDIVVIDKIIPNPGKENLECTRNKRIFKEKLNIINKSCLCHKVYITQNNKNYIKVHFLDQF